MLTGKTPLLPGRLPPDTRRKATNFARAAGSFVPRLTAKAFERYGFHSAEIMTDWARIAGAEVAAYSEPERIKWPRTVAQCDNGDGRQQGATLILRVEPARALEIEYRTGEIIDRINRYFGYRAIAFVKVLQAPLQRRAPEPSTNGPPPAASGSPPPLHLHQIEQDGLRQALADLWASIARERASKRAAP